MSMSSWSERPGAPARRRAAAEPELGSEGSSRSGGGQRSRAWVPLVILVTGLVLLLYSMQLGAMTTTGYDLQRLQAERNEWRQRNEQLQLELAKVQSLAWIEVEAVRRLGMQKAGRVTYLEVAPPAPPAEESEAPAAVAVAPPASEGPFLDILEFWRGVLAQIVPPVEAGP